MDPQKKPIALRCYNIWLDRVKKKTLSRRKSMLRQVVTVRGGPTTIRRMYFRDWVNWLYQRRMESRMIQIREKISKKNHNRKQEPDAYGISNVVTTVEVIRMTQVSVRSIKEMGSFTDEDNAKIQAGEAAIVEAKEKCAKALSKVGHPLVPAADQVEALQDFFENLITETDNAPGNLALAQQFLKVVKLDYGTLCEDRGLLAIAAGDGSLGYMQALLDTPEVRCDTVDVVSSCMFNQQFRIPATALALKFADRLKLDEYCDDLQDMWTEFFADITSSKRAIAREDRNGRIQLIRAMVSYNGIPIDQTTEGPDNQTVFSRAAHEGDTELMKVLLKSGQIDVNRVQSDSTTALIQAVFSGKVDAVQCLADHGVDPSHKSDDGTALAIAESLKRSPEIIKILKGMGAQGGGTSTLKSAPTFPPSGFKKKAEEPTHLSPKPPAGAPKGPKSTKAKAAEKAPPKPVAGKKAPAGKTVAPAAKAAPAPAPAKTPTTQPANTKNVGKEPPLTPQQKAWMEHEAFARKFWTRWLDQIHSLRQHRRRSMIRKVVQVRGSTTTVQRLYFRDWVNWVYQRRMENKMNQIRDKISSKKQKQLNKSASSPKGEGFTINKLMTSVDMINLTKMSVRSMVAMGSFTDEEMEKQQAGEKAIIEIKEKLGKQIKAEIVPSTDQRETLDEFFENLITETDNTAGNLALVQAFLKHVRLDYGTLCEDRGLLAIAAGDGSLGYMKALLDHPDIRCDPVDVVSSCMFNQQFRIPATAIALKYADKLKLGDYCDDLIDAWTEFFADIASNKRSIAREDRNGRIDLIRDMMNYSGIPIDHAVEGPDNQTVFSRAAHEGDTELMKVLLKSGQMDVDRVQSDNTTALIQAVFSGRVDAVECLADAKADPSHKSDDGTALDIAVSLKRSARIIEILKEMGGKEAGGSKLTRAPTFAPVGFSKGKGSHNASRAETPDDTSGYFSPRPPSDQKPNKQASPKLGNNSALGGSSIPSLPGLKPAKETAVAPMKTEAKKVNMDSKQRQDLLKKNLAPAMKGKLAKK